MSAPSMPLEYLHTAWQRQYEDLTQQAAEMRKTANDIARRYNQTFTCDCGEEGLCCCYLREYGRPEEIEQHDRMHRTANKLNAEATWLWHRAKIARRILQARNVPAPKFPEAA